MTNSKKIKVIITGATGMVGEGVLHECLLSPQVETILVIGRKACGVTHPKLKEIIHADFFNINPISEQLSGYDACYFCAGVSSVGRSKADYYHLTYEMTLCFARELCAIEPDMDFCYVSGAGTDSTEHLRTSWARIKGKTENDLMCLPFRHFFGFRPGYLHPTPGLRNTKSLYKSMKWVYPIGKKVFSRGFSTLSELGQAMIQSTLKGYSKRIIEVRDIKTLAKSGN